MRFRDWLEGSWEEAGYPIQLAEIKHGQLGAWLELLERLPLINSAQTHVDDTVEVGSDGDLSHLASVKSAIEALIPWRKGPFSFFGIKVDAEWRSDMKWHRLHDAVNWHGKSVLDVGSGNGYFGFRAIQAGARTVLGVESFLLYVLQAALFNWFARTKNVVIPLRFGVDALCRRFDVVLSMGVIYHQRNPDFHLRELAAHCKPGGQVVLESIVADRDLGPCDRYAGMRNIYLIPSVTTLKTKLAKTGFNDLKVVNVSLTTEAEQRRTRYMSFHSLRDSLDPQDNSRTIEGLPAPRRAILTAYKAA